MKIQLLLLFPILCCLFACSNPVVNDQPAETKLGTLSFEITGNDAAQTQFEEGMLLLHNFEYSRAAEKFQLAQAADSTCAMAYWGEAMTKNHPLWRRQNKKEALAIFEKIGASNEEQRASFKTDLEKDFYDAASILYSNEGTKPERDKAYSTFMSKLHKKHPGNNEIAAFYALSLLGTSDGKRDVDNYLKGAKIAQSIINENPNHPGALHYYY